MARTIAIWGPTALATPTCKLMADGDLTTVVETITLAEHVTVKRLYTGTVTAAADHYRYNLLTAGSYVGGGSIDVGATDGLTYEEDNLGDLSGTKIKLTSDGLDEVLVESGISAGASLTNDSGSELTSINARQAFALFLSTLAGALSGVLTGAPIFKPGGKPAGNTRVSSATTTDGRTTVTLKVPN